ncbi:MAG: ABC transporter permease [Gammaproteobacteria bacterium]
MKVIDVIRFSFHSVERAPTRTALMLLAMAIGVAAVVLLTGLGEAARRYVTDEFASLGTNLIIVLPGKSETTGGTLGASFSGSTRDLTIDDAFALTRHHNVRRVAPIIVGAAGVQHAGLEREVPIFGTTSEMLAIRHWHMAQGQFLPAREWARASPVCVIGSKIESELFGQDPAVGRWLRVGDSRFRVIGVLESEGRSIGVDVEEMVIVPVASTMALFNTQSMFRILVEAASRESVPSVKNFVSKTITARHHGEEDVTVITQDAVLDTFDQIFTALTMTVGGIAAISLAVAGVLIMNVMLVAVSQRTSEVGLLKAIGAAPNEIVTLFLAEAALLSLFGALIGLGVGLAGSWLVSQVYPTLNMTPPIWAVIAGVGVAIATGLVFGILPARRAAQLDPVLALAKR